MSDQFGQRLPNIASPAISITAKKTGKAQKTAITASIGRFLCWTPHIVGLKPQFNIIAGGDHAL